MNDQFICYDDGILEELYAIRKMSDEEFEKYIEELREKEKNKEQKY